jgi:hypothetical protein
MTLYSYIFPIPLFWKSFVPKEALDSTWSWVRSVRRAAQMTPRIATRRFQQDRLLLGLLGMCPCVATSIKTNIISIQDTQRPTKSLIKNPFYYYILKNY